MKPSTLAGLVALLLLASPLAALGVSAGHGPSHTSYQLLVELTECAGTPPDACTVEQEDLMAALAEDQAFVLGLAPEVLKEEQEPIIIPLGGSTGGIPVPSPFPDGAFVPEDLVLHDGSTQFGFYRAGYYTNGHSDMDQDGDTDQAELSCGSNPFSSDSTCADPSAGGGNDPVPDTADDDGDMTPNLLDKCPDHEGGSPLDADDDTDGDDVIDACDDDDDGDGVADADDNCPTSANGGQADLDGDGAGDACDDDDDGDGVADGDDAYPNDPTRAGDSDADGVDDLDDACADSNDALDQDGDGIPDGCDDDADGDGVPVPIDQDDTDPEDPGDLPRVPTSPLADGCDADGTEFTEECYQEPDPEGTVGFLLAALAEALGGLDGDEDGIPDAADNCAETANPDQMDTDLDGVGDACDEETAPLLPACDPALENVCVSKVPGPEDVPEDYRDIWALFLPDCSNSSKTLCHSGGGYTGIGLKIFNQYYVV